MGVFGGSTGVKVPVFSTAACTDDSFCLITTTAQTSAAAQVQTSLTVSAGTAPVDQTRVDQIRKAVQNGTYPVIPTRISDAMIAAGMMLGKAR